MERGSLSGTRTSTSFLGGPQGDALPRVEIGEDLANTLIRVGYLVPKF